MVQIVYADAPTKIELTILNDNNEPLDMSGKTLTFNITSIESGEKRTLGNCIGGSDGKVVVTIDEPPQDFLKPDDYDKYLQPSPKYVSTLIVNGYPYLRIPTRVVLL